MIFPAFVHCVLPAIKLSPLPSNPPKSCTPSLAPICTNNPIVSINATIGTRYTRKGCLGQCSLMQPNTDLLSWQHCNRSRDKQTRFLLGSALWQQHRWCRSLAAGQRTTSGFCLGFHPNAIGFNTNDSCNFFNHRCNPKFKWT